MKTRNIEIKVGIFVVIGIIVLLLGYFWLQQMSIKKSGYNITIHFDDASGLKRGDPVQVRGVDKGRVLSIELKEGFVEVRCYIDETIKLKRDAGAAIKDVALISGTKYIDLVTGEDEQPLDISKSLDGRGAPSFSLSELGNILEPIQSIAEKLSKEDLEKTLGNIGLASQELTALIKENRPGVKRTVKKAEEDLDKIVVVADQLDKNLEVLTGLLNDMNRGKGTMGKLMKDEKLYNELETTLKETKTLIKDIKQNPKKYINIRVF
jgi:phospholipid/cholesterol/gamma-HCH transport system substrate-binding protein